MPRGDLVQSVGKALDLLELLGDAGELRLADLCERTGLKSPTAHNLVRTLASRGFVEKRPGGRYRVGPAVAALAERGRERGFQAAVRDTLRDLGHALPATTLTFAVVEHAEVRALLRVDPQRPGRVETPRAQVFRPYGQVTGLAALAFAADEDALAIRERHAFYAEGAHLWQTPDALAAYLDGVRQAGAAHLPFPEPGVARVAVPVLRDGALLGVLGASRTLADSESAEEARAHLADALRTAAARLADAPATPVDGPAPASGRAGTPAGVS